jgi:electron transfer flavoprotein beta subunit
MKQVPDAEARLRVAKDGRWLEETDLPFVINESDECALEEAIRLVEQRGGEVIVISLGPERVREALRKALALGAMRAVHLNDEAFANGDAIATGRALAAALSREEGLDLVLTGSQSDDVGYGAVASVVAEHLGWPSAWLVMGIEVDDQGHSARVVREMEAGMNEILRLPLPAVIEVQAGINQPRYASLKGIMQSKRKEIAALSCGDLGLSPQQVGLAGSRLEIVSVAFPESGAGAQMLEGSVEETAKALVSKLRREARVL